jgi:hypothetical protein
MSDVSLKIIFASLFLAAGTAAFLAMMAVMGKPEKPAGTGNLRKAHKILGYAAITLLVPLAYIGSGFVREMGDGLSTRGVFHLVLAEALAAVLVLKILVVRFFRGFQKHAPALGMTIFALALVIYFLTVGFVFLQHPGG